MRKLIGDLLDLTRIEAGGGKRELTPLTLEKAAEQAVELHREGAAARGITLLTRFEPGVSMTADAAEIEMLFNNLVSNAVKYNRDGGSVSIQAAKEGGRVRIVCADTGIGMTAEETARLFKEFSRIKNEKTRKIPGSGLGLSIIDKIARLYGGSVSVASAPDQGTTFTVELEG
jgi:signal transduction histidine kinase